MQSLYAVWFHWPAPVMQCVAQTNKQKQTATRRANMKYDLTKKKQIKTIIVFKNGMSDIK